MNRRALKVILIVAILATATVAALVLSSAMAGTREGATVQEAGPSSEAAAKSAASIPFASLAPQQLDPAYQVEASDIVMVGRVVQVNEARWNSPDGKEWRGTSEEDMPVVYTTFYVQPVEILKGTPKWGTPVAFRTLGGLFGNARDFVTSTGEFADVAVGDRILVMGADRPFYGGSYETPAYWSLVNATSVYRESQGAYARLNRSGSAAGEVITLEQVRALTTTVQ